MHKTIVVTAPVSQLPEELKDDTAILDYDPPDVDDLKSILNGLLAVPNVKATLSPAEKEKLIRTALGLSANQAQRVFAKAIVSERVLDASDIALIGIPGTVRLAAGLCGSRNQTVHLLTDRYTHDDVARTPEIEIQIDPAGKVLVTGIAGAYVSGPSGSMGT